MTFQYTTSTCPRATQKRWLLGVVAFAMMLAILTVISPMIEVATDTTVGDAIIRETCWDRHGLNFIGRWSCRSAINRMGPVAVILSCAANKNNPNKSDLCRNLEKGLKP